MLDARDEYASRLQPLPRQRSYAVVGSVVAVVFVSLPGPMSVAAAAAPGPRRKGGRAYAGAAPSTHAAEEDAVVDLSAARRYLHRR